MKRDQLAAAPRRRLEIIRLIIIVISLLRLELYCSFDFGIREPRHPVDLMKGFSGYRPDY